MKTDILNGLLALKIVAEKGNFTAAAAEMGVSPSAISQTIKHLEKSLNSVLLTRTTRSIALTDLGEQFLKQYQPGLEQVMAAVEQLESLSEKPVGTLRINLPRAAWPILVGPVLEGFRKQYPEIIVELYFEDSFVDVVGGGFDAGIRPSEMTAKDMTAIRISPPHRYVVACSSKYLKSHIKPKHPKDLLTHNCIQYKSVNGFTFKRWDFIEKGRDFSIEIHGSLTVNDPLIAIECAIKNLGLIYITDDLLKEAVDRKELVILLEEFAPGSDGYYLYYPSVSQVSPKLRAFIDFLKGQKKI
jgi:DNA-binding transcriptional LysR family regulator